MSVAVSCIIPAGTITEDLVNFPVTIRLSSSCGTTAYDGSGLISELGANYQKLVATKDGVSLSIEVERWDTSALEATLHIKAPGVEYASDAEIRIEADSLAADNSLVGAIGTSAGQVVWDSYYEAVYHMADDPSGGVLTDSTSNGNTGTPYGTMTAGDLVGIESGYAWDLDGSDDYVEIDSVASGVATAGEYTTDVYAKPTTAKQCIPLAANLGGGNMFVMLWYYSGWQIYLVAPSGGATSGVTALDTWSAISFAYDSTSWDAFADGASFDTGTTTTTLSASANWSIGQEYDSAAKGDYFPGPVAEIRISKVKRSTSWMKLTALTLRDEVLTISSASEVVKYRNSLDQDYDLVAELRRNLLDQDYAMLVRMLNGLDQLWSLRQLAKLDQLYWNMPQYRAGLTQRYGDCVFMRRLLDQDYGELYRYRTDLEQVYNFPEGLRQMMVQKYGIAEEALRGHCDQVYDLSEFERHRAQLQQLWVLISAGSVVLNYDVQVQAFNGPDVLTLGEGSAIVTELHPYNINQEQDEDLYHMSGELQLVAESEFKVCRHLKTIIQIRVGTRVARYVVEDPRREKGSNGEVIYGVPLASPTLLLGHSDSPYSAIEDQPLVGMAKDLVEMLAAPVASVDWRMVNRYIPSPVWRTNGKRRIELIKDLVHAWGGIVQTLTDNTLVCRPRYPVDVNLWRTAAPQVQLSDQADFFSLTPSVDPRDGYNSFYLADSDIDGDGVTIMEEEIDAYTKKVKVYLQPWDDDEVVILHHSGGSWVTIIFHGVKNGLEEKQIEIVGGSGQVDLPVHELQGVEWRQNDLGEIEAAEDGTLTSDIDGNSLALVIWSTRYHEFTVIDPKAEDVQIWAEVV